MSAKHTPGPWIADTNNTTEHPAGPAWVRVQDDAGRLVELCELCGPSPEKEANARLMAEAPEMLFILELFLRELGYLGIKWNVKKHASLMIAMRGAQDVIRRVAAAEGGAV